MEPIKRLDSHDFFLEQNNSAAVERPETYDAEHLKSKQILKVRLLGPVLIFFYTNDCDFCKTAKPVFFKISNTIPLAMVNLSLNLELVNVSKLSNLPLTFVPRLILFNDGNPIKEFNQEFTPENINHFISDSSNSAKHQEDSEDLGIPVSKNICYVDFESAYPTK